MKPDKNIELHLKINTRFSANPQHYNSFPNFQPL